MNCNNYKCVCVDTLLNNVRRYFGRQVTGLSVETEVYSCIKKLKQISFREKYASIVLFNLQPWLHLMLCESFVHCQT